MADKDSRAGVRYDDADIRLYTARTHAPHDAALTAAFEAPEREGVPAIQVGPDEGRTLEILLRAIGARTVVEIGTLVGYSALWMARALPEGGRLITLEKDPRHAELARRHFEAAGLQDRVDVRVGAARDHLEDLAADAPFCAVFLDADKGGYADYGRWAAKNLRSGGLLIGDNAYLFGRLLDSSEEAESMRVFHEETAAHFHSVCLPTPDGLVVGLKK